MFYFVLQLLYLIAMVFVDIVAIKQDNKRQLEDPIPLQIAVEGYLEVQAQFYLFFLTPLRIADKYRATQEVTPAGTIYAVNTVFSALISSYIRIIIMKGFNIHEAKDPIQRLFPPAFLAIAIAVGARPALREYRQLKMI